MGDGLLVQSSRGGVPQVGGSDGWPPRFPALIGQGTGQNPAYRPTHRQYFPRTRIRRSGARARRPHSPPCPFTHVSACSDVTGFKWASVTSDVRAVTYTRSRATGPSVRQGVEGVGRSALEGSDDLVAAASLGERSRPYAAPPKTAASDTTQAMAARPLSCAVRPHTSRKLVQG